MKAVVMAGGRGERLRPLTETLPKPMVRLCGKPVLEYVLELLAKNGVTECTIATGYLADVIESHFSNRHFAGMQLSFCRESRPLGTAGSVRHALQKADGPVLVASGDALCDFPLREALAFHQRMGALATLVGVSVDDPREYGLILSDPNGWVTGFLEKPSFSRAAGGLANTGIYILSPEGLDMIPDGEFFDFATGLFPQMLRERLPVACCQLPGYWCDIGDLGSYRRAQADLLSGKVDCALRGQRDQCGNLTAQGMPAGDWHCQGPAYIGAGVVIGPGAVIGAGSVLDDGCAVGAGSMVSGGVLLPHSRLGADSCCLSGILCSGAAVGSHAAVLEDAAIGPDAVISDGAAVQKGVRIAAQAKAAENMCVSRCLPAGTPAVLRFDDNGLQGRPGIDFTPELAARLGCAIGAAAGSGPVGLCISASRFAQVLSGAMISGIRSAGANVLDMGTAFESLFGFAMGYNALTIGVFLGDGYIRLMGSAGLPVSRETERRIEQSLCIDRFPYAGKDAVGNCFDLSGINRIYFTELPRLAPEGLEGMRAQVRSKNPAIRRMLEEALQKLGCTIGGSLVLEISPDGSAVVLQQGDIILRRQRAVAAYCMMMFEKQQDVAVESDFPKSLDFFARQHGRRVYRYLHCPSGDEDQAGRRVAASQQCARDGLMLSVLLLGYMRRKKLSLAALNAQLPAFESCEGSVAAAQPPGKLLEKLHGEIQDEGILLREDKGLVLLRPSKLGDKIRIFAEASNWETAGELCADVQTRLHSLDNHP